MPKPTDRHVVPDGNGGWKVVAPNAQRASARTDTQAAAESIARQIVRNAGGGEVVTHRPNGRIRDSDTVPHGNDPVPPRDTK
jgi:Tfp pilus assembly protein PilW